MAFKDFTQQQHEQHAQCAQYVPGRWGAVPCRREATMTEDGKQWCAWHAPSKVAARTKAKEQRRRDRERMRATKMDAEFRAEDRKRAEIEEAGIDLSEFAVLAKDRYYRMLSGR